MEFVDIARIFFALLAVIAMIGLFALIARKAGFSSGGFSLNRDRRLSLVEVLPLDNRRRAAIIRCDNREHLVVLNPNNVTVIERGLSNQSQAKDGVVEASEQKDENEVAPATAAPGEITGPQREPASSFAAALKKLRQLAPSVASFKKAQPAGDNSDAPAREGAR